MKTLLAAFLLTLASFTSHAQGTWPRNPKTGQVEFRGTLSWPKDVKTEGQRRALVRRWYLAKLTEMSAENIGIAGAASKSNALFTYAGLPKAIVLQQGEGIDSYLLGYHAEFIPSTTVFNYALTSFELQRSGDVQGAAGATPLEQLILNATPSERAALAALRKRLAVALASW